MSRRSSGPVRGVKALAFASLPLSLATMAAPLAAQAVVQAMPDPAAADLRIALQRLGADPRNLAALLAAGHASLKLDDVDAAEGFFLRAMDVASGNPDAMIGLALVSLRREDARGSLTRFAEAGAAGGDLAPWSGERGLALDLVGANALAQKFYKQTLASGPDDEIVRRLALSYAITGDGPASEAMLLPLLQRRDLAAFRARAFSLAILGREEESLAIAKTMLPARVANRLTPYLRYMPRLTPAQQAAAANLGVFPEAGRIGRDDPALLAFAEGSSRTAGPSAEPASPGSRPVPGGDPLGSQGGADRAVAAQPQSGPVLPPPAPAAPARAASEPVPPPIQPDPAPERDQAQPPDARRFAEAFGIYGPVDESVQSRQAPAAQPQSQPAIQAGAADAVPAHPARYWVQLGIGQNISAFAHDWRKRVREAGGLLDSMKPYRAPATGTNRLLTGPFDSAAAAGEMVTKLKAAGVDALRYSSDEGEEVVPLG